LNVTEFEGYRLCWVYGQTCATTRAQLVAFWLENAALSEAYEAWRRTFEVTCIAVDRAGQIVGVSSVYSAPCRELGAPYWFYRTFIRPDSRFSGLAQRMLKHTVEQLAEAFAGEPGAPVGMIIAPENPKLEAASARRQLQRLGFLHLGADAGGRSIWRRRFTA
jgi:GNAT superfamily N-acetyltransferase